MTSFQIHRGSTVHRSVSVAGFELTDSTFPAGMGSPVHDHARPVLSITLSGRFEHRLEGEEAGCTEAVGFVKPAGEPHQNEVGTVPSRVLSIEPSATMVDRLGRYREVFDEPREVPDPRIGEIAWRLVGEIERPDDLWALVAEGLLLQALGVVGRTASRRTVPRPEWLNPVLELLHDRFRDPPRLAWIAAEVGVEERELAEGFRDHLHVSVGSYARRLRIQHACRRLTESDEPIARIATGSGFSDQSHLTRVMKKALGVTPAEYRRGHL
ncbi:MAG: AraC family transcriptional regulator [Gemmatimonadota bacterium]|nr:AraC family transcriptional regulator [Gemmatimonadota bacterium]